MKKTYLNPNMEVVKIEVRQIIAASPNAALDPSQSVNPGSVEAPEFDFLIDE